MQPEDPRVGCGDEFRPQRSADRPRANGAARGASVSLDAPRKRVVHRISFSGPTTELRKRRTRYTRREAATAFRSNRSLDDCNCQEWPGSARVALPASDARPRA